MIEYYVLDTETTGLQAGFHEITQISIIRCSDRNQLNKFIKASYPERATQQALDVTKRTYSDLFKGEDRLSVVERCNEFFNEDGADPSSRCIIAHNARFDRNFCHVLWASLDRKFPADLWMDTKDFAKEYAVKNGIYKPKLTLASSLKFTKVKAQPGEHDAVVDSRNTYLLWSKLMDSDLEYLDFIKNCPHILE